MKRARVLVIALALAAPWALAAPAGADGHLPVIPDDGHVPPNNALTKSNVNIGTNESERIEGTDGPDAICARLGDDGIEAGAGDDLILGDTSTFFGNVQAPGGDDRITGGAGDD